MTATIKLSSPATHEFWELPVLFEDDHLLALDKPAGLLTSPDRFKPEHPSLMQLLHDGIAAGKPWALARRLAYLSNAHRLDAETSGVLLLAKTRPALLAVADLFGSEQPLRKQLALAHGAPAEEKFGVNAKLGPHPVQAGAQRVDPRGGKKSKTAFTVLERFTNCALLECELLTDRAHQVRVHLAHAGWPVVGDELYGGKPLWLSRFKKNYRLKPGHEERPLISRAAVHAAELSLPHPVTGDTVLIRSELPKDLKVALKYLRLLAK
jgi:23S rRNA pseudouridine1911/1915/1917 synthase